mmetsp:Transcript_1272/g.2820  ORF Transcript_1272/g.2820 Transcript_1272/m.2820 type:complete len:214 (-) Transcript_1272:208-849(-)
MRSRSLFAGHHLGHQVVLRRPPLVVRRPHAAHNLAGLAEVDLVQRVPQAALHLLDQLTKVRNVARGVAWVEGFFFLHGAAQAPRQVALARHALCLGVECECDGGRQLVLALAVRPHLPLHHVHRVPAPAAHRRSPGVLAFRQGHGRRPRGLEDGNRTGEPAVDLPRIARAHPALVIELSVAVEGFVRRQLHSPEFIRRDDAIVQRRRVLVRPW